MPWFQPGDRPGLTDARDSVGLKRQCSTVRLHQVVKEHALRDSRARVLELYVEALTRMLLNVLAHLAGIWHENTVTLDHLDSPLIC